VIMESKARVQSKRRKWGGGSRKKIAEGVVKVSALPTMLTFTTTNATHKAWTGRVLLRHKPAVQSPDAGRRDLFGFSERRGRVGSKFLGIIPCVQ